MLIRAIRVPLPLWLFATLCLDDRLMTAAQRVQGRGEAGGSEGWGAWGGVKEREVGVEG